MHEQTREDTTLLSRIASRDEAALGLLYDRYSRLLFGLVLRVVRNRAEAEDVLQEVFVQVWTKIESYRAELGTPVAWLVRIARNRAIDRLRATSVRDRAVAEERAHAPAGSVVDVEAEVQRTEEQRVVARALEALPTDQRELIEHAYFMGLTHSELAERFKLPLGTVKTRVRLGLLALRRDLAGVPQFQV